ncbi:MAG: RsmD family RNA methyltransferase [Miltoncostaeaceae bacterium]
MRIVAGEFGGRRIRAPRGRGTRPTSDRVREAMFAMIGPIEGERVLDLFAGSGAVALEALSRGAREAVAVERAGPALACIRQNAETLGVGGGLRVVGRDWRAALAGEVQGGRWYGVCVADPPYDMLTRILPDLGPALAAVVRPGGTVVIEHAGSRELAGLPGLAVSDVRTRRHGDSALTVLRLEETS